MIDMESSAKVKAAIADLQVDLHGRIVSERAKR